MPLNGKVALVTGAGSGIGRAAAELLAREGARVALLDQSEQETREAVEQIRRRGGEAMPLTADISQPEEVRTAVSHLGESWGRIDILFANAGINGVWAPLEELDPSEWDRTLQVNLKGTFLTLKYSVPWLKKQGGSVIITSSVNGTRMFSNTGASAYATSKAGQVAFAKMTALELAPFGVRVNVICPGAIETNIGVNTERRDVDQVKTPVKFPEGKVPLTQGKLGRPEQVAQLVLFLASDASDHITGTENWIDGGQSLLQG